MGRMAFVLSPSSGHFSHQLLDLVRTGPGPLPQHHHNAAGSACAGRAAPRTVLPWLVPRRARPRFASAVGIEELPEDKLWWGVASPVKSLQILCRDAEGSALDPWRLSELMMDLGAMSVSIDDSSLGTEEEEPIMDDKVPDPLVPSDTGRKEMWGGASRVRALFPGRWDLEGVVSSVREVLELSSPLTFEVGHVGNEDWIKNVQEGWDPIEVGRLRIRFPWHEALPSSQANPSQVELELEGGASFGTGEHPTTSLCLEWLDENSPDQRVLDYGSGSGILSLAALKFGAREAIGVEIDPGAILSAASNAERNGLGVDIYHPQEVASSDHLVEDVLLTKASTPESAAGLLSKNASPSERKVIRAAELGAFDITIANILAAPLVRLRPVLAGFTRPGGKLALSGVLETQAETILEAYGNDFFKLEVTKTLEGWVLISGVRRAPELRS